MANLKLKTKKQLEEIGREYGVELDRRKSKAALIAEVEELLLHVDGCECGKTEDEFGKCDASHAKVLTEVPETYAWSGGYLVNAQGYKLQFGTKGAANNFRYENGIDDGKVKSEGISFVIKQR